MGSRKRIVLTVVAVVAAFSVLIGLLINRSNDSGERSRQTPQHVVVGRPVSLTESDCGRGCVFLPVVAANAGSTSETGSVGPEAALTVVAQASNVCQAEGAVPVAGARITVVTDRDTQMSVTDSAGLVLFEPAGKPAVVQIEWPVGLLPCPNSRPMVELASGAGEVKFLASPAAYP